MILGISKTEMNGLVFFIPIIVFFIFLPSIYTRVFQTTYEPFEDQRILDSLVALIEANKDSIQSDVVTPERFFFDPNSLSQDSFLLLGISASIAQRIINYRNAKGVFKRPKDFSKMYGLSDSLYQDIQPWIRIIQKPQKMAETVEIRKEPVVSDVKSKKVEFELISINRADTLEWMRLRGIGPAYSKRIIRFREALGGFVSVDQISEVYGLSDSLFSSILPYLVLTDSVPRKLSINFASFKELNGHPYITYEQTREILNSKSSRGKYRSIENLLELKSFDSLSVKRLIPYLDFR